MDVSFYLALFFISCAFCHVVSQEIGAPPQIVSKTTVGHNDSFTVWCNISSYRDVQLPERDYIKWIGITRETKLSVVQIIAIYAPFSDDLKLYKKIPKDRDWQISYGGGEGEFNKDTISINLTVNDAGCQDAGKYMCWVSLPDNEVLPYSTPSYLLPRFRLDEGDTEGCSGESVLYPIIDKRLIAPKEAFTVTCDLTKFYDVHLPPNKDITSLGIVRQRESGDKEEIAAYYPLNLPDKRLDLKTPEGRQWMADASGQKEDIRLVLIVKDAQCQDAGTYMCSIKFANQDRAIHSSPFVLRARVMSDNVVDGIKVDPAQGVANETSSYYEGTNITMECTYRGHGNLTSNWGSTRASAVMSNAQYQPVTEIQDDQGCPIYLHSSTYSFTMEEIDNRATYYCMVFEGYNKVGTSSVRFLLQKRDPEATKEMSRATIIVCNEILIFVLFCVCQSKVFGCLIQSN